MKKVDTSLIVTGRAYPPSKKGFDFLHTSYTEILAALAQAICSNNVTGSYAMYGCKKTFISGINYSFTDGYVYHTPTKEVYYFPAVASISLATAPVITITNTTPAPENPVTFTDGSFQSPHMYTELVVSDGALGSADINYQDLIFVQFSDTWHKVGGTGEPAFLNSFTNNYGAGARSLQFKRTKEVVTIRGTIANTGSINQIVFTLPAGYIPNDYVYGTCFENGAVSNLHQLYVDASGNVTIDGAASTNKVLDITITYVI